MFDTKTYKIIAQSVLISKMTFFALSFHMEHPQQTADKNTDTHNLCYCNAGMANLKLVNTKSFNPESSKAVSHQINAKHFSIIFFMLPIQKNNQKNHTVP